MASYRYSVGIGEFSDGDLSKLLEAAARLNLSPAQMADWVEHAAVATNAPDAPLSSAEHDFFVASSGLSDGAATSHVETAAQQQARLLRTSLTTKDVGERLGVGPDAIRHRLAKQQLWSFFIAGQHRLPTWQFESVSPASIWGTAHRKAPRMQGQDIHQDLLFEPSPGWEVVSIKPAMQAWFHEVEGVHGPMYARLVVHDGEGNVLRELDDAPLIADDWTTLPGLEKVVPAIPVGTTPVALEGFMTAAQDELLVGGHPWSPRRWLSEGLDPELVAKLVADLGNVW
jgi:hypothetical protein